MPRSDDDYDDDRPSRRPRDDDDGDRPRKRIRRENDEDFGTAPPRKKSNLGLILGIVGGVLLLLLVCGGVGIWMATSKIRGAAERMESSNNLKQIGLGMHNYADTYTGFPTNSYDENGKPLLSWRVHILPYIEQDQLYRQFKLDEPWDGPNNSRLLNQMPAIYATSAERKGRTPKGSKTFYRGFSSPGAVFSRESLNRNRRNPFEKPFEHPTTVSPMQFMDGTSNTILVIEAGEAVEWTKPEDLDASPGKPFPPVGGYQPDAPVVMVLMADGSVRSVKKTLPESQWRPAITHSGNEMTDLD